MSASIPASVSLTSVVPTAIASNNISALPTPSANVSSILSSITSFVASATSEAAPKATNTGSFGDGIIFNNAGGRFILSTAQNPAAISTQFIICFVVGLITFLAFCIFRTKIPVLFAPRNDMKLHKPPELPASLFGWIIPLIKIGDEEMLTNVGLDAVLMLKFIVMAIKIFAICCFFGVVVFFPLTLTSDHNQTFNATGINHLSISAIPDGSNKYIAYLIFAYLFTFITFFFLNGSYNEYIYLRAKFLISQAKSMVSRSIMVTGVPPHLRTDQALADYYEKLDIGSVESCYIVREVDKLDTLVKRRANALMKLEKAYASYWGNPCRIPGYDPDRILDDAEMYKKVLDLAEQRHSSSESSSDEEVKRNSVTPTSSMRKKKKKKGNTTFFKGLVEPKFNINKPQSRRPTVRVGGFWGLGSKKVDAIEYYTSLFDELDKMVIERRRSPEYDMANVGFVTFEQMSSAVIASQIAINPAPFICRTSMASEPRDILWTSIGIRGRERVIREIVIWSITLVLVLTFTLIVSSISGLVSLSSIEKVNKALAERIGESTIGNAVFSSLLPTIILNIFTSILPFIFDAMGYYQGLRTRSAIAESTLSKYYFFLIYLSLILYSVVGTSITLWVELSNDLQSIPKRIANTLPKLAPFFINYTILQAFLVMPLNLLLLGSIFLRGFWHLFICSTPREHAENRTPWAFNYGIGYPAPLLIFAIVFEYSLINPLILLFGVVYFCMTYVVYKYQFLYVYFRPYEAAGKLWLMVIPRVVFTLVLFQLTLLGLFLLDSAYVLGGLVVPLIIITILFKYLLDLAYEKNGRNMPMQILRDNLQGTPTGSDIDSDEEDDRVIESSALDREKAAQKEKEAQEQSKAARNRWQSAAKGAILMKQEQEPKAPLSPQDSKDIIVRPRHRKVVLDEDDYEATPSRLTDYCQPPMQLNPGILDSGLKKYGNPLLVGVLPQLWLPVKADHEKQTQNPENNRRRSDLMHNRISGGGNLALHLAEIMRKVETESKSQQNLRESNAPGSPQVRITDEDAQDALIAKSKQFAHDDAHSIVEAKPHPKINALRSLFKRGAIKQSNVHDIHGITDAQDFRLQHMDDATVDSVERGQHGNSNDHLSVKSSARSVHQVYYHHPERRKSHVQSSEFLALPQRPEPRSSNLSSPALNFSNDNEAIAETIDRPDTQNSRHSSAPLIKRD